MKSKTILEHDDAVSISVGFILMFAITVLIFSTVVLSFYALSEQYKKEALRENFKMLGSGLAVKLTTMDMIVNVSHTYGGSVNALEYEFTIPASIVAEGYAVNITNSTHEIIIESNLIKTVTPYSSSTNLAETRIYSAAENYLFRYDRTADSIIIEET